MVRADKTVVPVSVVFLAVIAVVTLLLVQLAFALHPAGPEIVGFGAVAATAFLVRLWDRL